MRRSGGAVPPEAFAVRGLMRILLADARHLARAGLRQLLDTIVSVEVVAEVSTVNKAVAAARASRVDAIIVNPRLPDAPNGRAIGELHQQCPRVAILVLAASGDAASVRAALASGALGYMTWDSHPAELELALTALSREQVYITPQVSERLMERRSLTRTTGPRVFSRRQREVLQMIGRGHSTREIAEHLGISVKTVETHRARLMETLEVKGSAGLLRYAISVGVPEPA
jgi:DNA-binding NarL/FixJ family response regulator